MQRIGRIYGEIIGERFTFASKKFFKGDYVKIKEDEARDDSAELIGEVIIRGVSNRFLTTPEVIKYLDDSMDFERDTIYTYTVERIGAIKNGEISFERVNAIPGKNVYTVNPEMLKTVYGIGNKGQKIGYLRKMSECDVILDAQKIFSPHLFIVGKTGSGKSYFTKKFFSYLNETFWIFSPTDEYNDLGIKNTCKILNDFTLNLDNLSYYADLNASEELIFKNLKFQNERSYTFQEIVDEIYEYYIKKNNKKAKQISFDFVENDLPELELPTYANTLISKLKNLRHLKFVKSNKFHQISQSSIVFELSKYTQLEQECIINYYLFNLFQRCSAKSGNDRKKYIIVIEEAHNYMPSVRNTLCKSILGTLSRQGRKHGISLCFITQRPRFFDQTALSQSGNKVIFALPNPDDVKHIMEDVNKSELAMLIPNQRVGECIIAGDAFNDLLQVVIQFNTSDK